MNRRDVITRVGQLVLVLVPLYLLAACGSSSNSNDQNNPSADVVAVSSVAAGHTHTFTIPNATLTAPPTDGYTSTDSLTDAHQHEVTFTKIELEAIQSGQEVFKGTSTVNGHSHTYKFKK